MPHIRSNSLPQSKEKWMDSGIAGLGLSLDVLIYIIRYGKLKSCCMRVYCLGLEIHVYIHG